MTQVDESSHPQASWRSLQPPATRWLGATSPVPWRMSRTILTRFSWLSLIILSGYSTSLPAAAQLNLTPDRSTESRVETVNSTTDRISGGVRSRSGSHLFHSFAEFNVREGRTVVFQVPAGVQDILSRVTGSDPSDILGTLTTEGSANLYLLNPNGFIFGPNARININGSLIVSTGDRFRFTDGGEFSASEAIAPPLLSIGITPGLQTGTVPLGDVTQAGNLSVASGQTLLLLGKAIESRGRLAAPNGSLQIVGNQWTADQLSFDLAVPSPRLFSVEVGDRLTILNSDLVFNSTDLNGSEVSFSAGNAIDIRNSRVLSQSSSINPGLPLNFSANQMTMAQSSVNVINQSSGRGSALRVTANQLDLDRSNLRSLTTGTGDQGDVLLQVDRFNMARTSELSLLNFGSGAGGNLRILAEQFSLSDRSTIALQALSTGTTGNLFLQAQTLRLSNASGIGNQVGSLEALQATGNGGNTEIQARSLVLSRGSGIGNATYGSGNGGDLTIAVPQLVITDGSGVGVQSYNRGNAGRLVLRGNQMRFVNRSGIESAVLGTGTGGDVFVSADRMVMTNDSGILSGQRPGVAARRSSGNGGNITVVTDSLQADRGGGIVSQALGSGRAGDIRVRAAGSIILRHSSGFSSNVAEAGTGDSGNLWVQAETIVHTGGSQISTTSRGQGNAGDMTIRADRIRFTGVDRNRIVSGISSFVYRGAVGNTGNIDLRSRQLTATEGAGIYTGVVGTGNAGNVTLVADEITLRGVNRFGVPSGVSSSIGYGRVSRSGGVTNTAGGFLGIAIEPSELAEADTAIGNSGQISIRADRLVVQDGARLSTATFARGNAGNINIQADTVLFAGTAPVRSTQSAVSPSDETSPNATQRLIQSGAFSGVRPRAIGNGGNLRIRANTILVRDGAQLVTSTLGRGNAGDAAIAADTMLSLSGVAGNDSPSGIFATAQATAQGQAGSLTIEAGAVRLHDRAEITVSNQAQGDSTDRSTRLQAGQLTIQAHRISLDQRSRLSAESVTGRGGNIRLAATDSLLLRTNSQISSISGRAGVNGQDGNISITAPFLVTVPTENSDILATGSGRVAGSNLVINAAGAILGSTFQPTPTDRSDLVAAGSVTLRTPRTDPAQGLFQFPTNLVDRAQQIAPGCARATTNNQFILTGRAGLPLSPDEPLQGMAIAPPAWISLDFAPPLLESLPALPHRDTHSEVAIVEADQWTFNPDGSVVLTAHSIPVASAPAQSICPSQRAVRL